METPAKRSSVHPFPLAQMKIKDSWFGHYVDLIRTSVIPYQYRALHGYPGHHEIKLVLVRLWRITKMDRYLDLAKYSIFQRGTAPNYFIEERQSDDFFEYYPGTKDQTPMEVWPDNCIPYTSRRHVKPTRQPWFSCACCPPNLARIYAGLGRYLLAGDALDGVPCL